MQYEVVTDGKYVYKTLHTVKKSAALYRKYGFGLKTWNLHKLAAKTLDDAKRSLEGVRRLLKRHPELAPSLANPVIADDFSYRQDRVTILGEALRQATPARARQYIDEYIDLLLFHASYGIGYPFIQAGRNYGVDQYDHVVLTDLGELVFDKEAAVAAAAATVWKKRRHLLLTLWVLYQKHDPLIPQAVLQAADARPVYARSH